MTNGAIAFLEVFGHFLLIPGVTALWILVALTESIRLKASSNFANNKNIIELDENDYTIQY